MLGQLNDLGGRWQLQFTRTLAHPPEKVWRALTDNEHLKAWFPAQIQGDRATGAALRFVFLNDEGPPVDGEMIACDPPSVLEYRWGEATLRFELQPSGDGTLLNFLHTFDELGRAARDGTGWHACFDLLELHLAGDEPKWSPGDRWQELHPSYIERFGPEAATIGPPRPPADST